MASVGSAKDRQVKQMLHEGTLRKCTPLKAVGAAKSQGRLRR
jgi:hypothetical protein